MPLTVAYSFIALLLLIAASGYLLLPRSTENKALYALSVLLIASIVLLVPIQGNPVFYYLRGFLGDLSISSSIFYGAYVIKKGFGKNVYQEIEVRYLIYMVIFLGLVLYPLTLGLGQLDPYRLGYQPRGLAILLFFSAVYFWHRSYYFLLFLVTGVAAAFTLGLLESNNLWDYLLDAFFWLFCITAGLFSNFRAGLKRPRP